MKPGSRIRERRLLLGLSVSDVADALGKNRATVYRYESGYIEDLPTTVLEPLARVLQTTPAYLAGWTDEPAPPVHPDLLPIAHRRRIPLLGEIACGEPIYSPSEAELVDVDEGLTCDSAMICRGDSMIGARIYDGDLVYVRRQDDVDDGQIAAVAIDGELTLKRVFKLRDLDDEGNVVYRVELRAENPRYAPIRIGGPDETRQVNIVGRAVAFRSALP